MYVKKKVFQNEGRIEIYVTEKEYGYELNDNFVEAIKKSIDEIYEHNHKSLVNLEKEKIKINEILLIFKRIDFLNELLNEFKAKTYLLDFIFEKLKLKQRCPICGNLHTEIKICTICFLKISIISMNHIKTKINNK